MVRDITERMKAEGVLRESEARFRQLAENIESVFWMASANLDRMLYVSPAYETIWGRTTASLCADPKSFMEAIHPEDRARIEDNLRQNQVTKQQAFVVEYRITRPDGSLRWVRDRGFPIKNAAGRFERMVGIAEDITEWKQAELRTAAFANLGNRLGAANTAREAGEIIVDVADELLGWDSCVFDLYSAAEDRVSHILAMDIMDGQRAECKPPAFWWRPSELARKAIERGGQLILRDEQETASPKGVPFGNTSRASAALMFVPVRHGKEVVGLLSIQSYTPQAYDAYSLETLQALADHGGGALRRLRAQDALNESEAMFRSVWEDSVDGMRLTDQDGRIIAVNEAFCRLVKLPREKLEQQSFSVTYMAPGADHGSEVYQKLFASGTVAPRLATSVQLWNAARLDLEISSSFITLGRRGKMLLSIFRDVSERKRAKLRVEAFSKLGQQLSAAKTVLEAAELVSEVAGDLLGWDACSFSVLLPSGDLLKHVLQVDTIEGRRVISEAGY
jgi:PAS domain S-box-containing protein